MKKVIGVLILTLLTCCMKSKHANILIHHGHIVSIQENRKNNEALALLNGKILEIGPERQILNKYNADTEIDAQSGYIYPLLSDADFPYFEILYHSIIQNIEDNDSDIKKYTLIEKSIDLNKNSSKYYFLNWTKIKDSLQFSSKIKLLSKSRKIYLFSKNCGASNQLFVNQTIKPITEEAKTNISKFSQSLLKDKAKELDNECIEKGIASVHLHGITIQELATLKKISTKGKLTFYIYLNANKINVNEIIALKKSSSSKIKIAGLFIDNRCISPFQEIKTYVINKQLQMSFSHDYFKKNKTLIDKILSSINSDHRWRVVHIDSLSSKDYFEIVNLNLYPTISSNTILSQNFPEKIEMIGIGYGKFDPSKKISTFLFSKKNNVQKNTIIKAYCGWNAVHSFSENKFTLIEKNKKANFSVYPIQLDKALEIPYIQHQYIDGKKHSLENLLN
jgi:hypothetical protein